MFLAVSFFFRSFPEIWFVRILDLIYHLSPLVWLSSPGMPSNSPARKLTSSVLSWSFTLPIRSDTATHHGFSRTNNWRFSTYPQHTIPASFCLRLSGIQCRRRWPIVWCFRAVGPSGHVETAVSYPIQRDSCLQTPAHWTWTFAFHRKISPFSEIRSKSESFQG